MKTLTRRLKTAIKTSLNEQLYIEELAKQTFFLEEKEGGSKNIYKIETLHGDFPTLCLYL